jgi:hypothetical protein
VKVFLKDFRVDTNLADEHGCTPLWWASRGEHLGMIRWMIASGRDLNLDTRGQELIARTMYGRTVVSLLRKFIQNQGQTRREVRLELGLVDMEAAELFAMTVFLCDDYLRIKEPTASSTTSAGCVRFFNIISTLPMELQMVLCYRVCGLSKETILSRDSEPAFKSHAEHYSSN